MYAVTEFYRVSRLILLIIFNVVTFRPSIEKQTDRHNSLHYCGCSFDIFGVKFNRFRVNVYWVFAGFPRPCRTSGDVTIAAVAPRVGSVIGSGAGRFSLPMGRPVDVQSDDQLRIGPRRRLDAAGLAMVEDPSLVKKEKKKTHTEVSTRVSNLTPKIQP